MRDIMKSSFAGFLACASGFLVPATSCAEDWAYTGFYPYVYSYSTDSWLFEPANSPLVWDFSQGDWVPNPLGGRSFDLRETFDQFPLQLDMTIDGRPEISMRIVFNFSGVDTSVVSWTAEEHSESSTVYTRHSVDAEAGTCLMYGSFAPGYEFALELDFETSTSGTYRMIAIYPFFTYTMDLINHLGTVSGPFTIEPLLAE